MSFSVVSFKEFNLIANLMNKQNEKERKRERETNIRIENRINYNNEIYHYDHEKLVVKIE